MEVKIVMPTEGSVKRISVPYINKELQRVKKATMNTLESKDIIFTFPEQGIKNSTALVLKKPKTTTSNRKVFLPKTVAEMLVAWKMEQDATIMSP